MCFAAVWLGHDGMLQRGSREPARGGRWEPCGIPPLLPPDAEQPTRVLKVDERRRGFVYSIFLKTNYFSSSFCD